MNKIDFNFPVEITVVNPYPANKQLMLFAEIHDMALIYKIRSSNPFFENGSSLKEQTDSYLELNRQIAKDSMEIEMIKFQCKTAAQIYEFPIVISNFDTPNIISIHPHQYLTKELIIQKNWYAEIPLNGKINKDTQISMILLSGETASFIFMPAKSKLKSNQ